MTITSSVMASQPESQLQCVLGTLLDSISIVGAKGSTLVMTETITSSIRRIAEKHPNQVLNSCCHFCLSTKTAKSTTPPPTKQHVLNIMQKICNDHIIEIDGDTILSVIELSLDLMIETPNAEPLVQEPCSEILVALGRKHHIQVMEYLLTKMGDEMHFMIPHTLGALAGANPSGIVPHLKSIFSKMLPLVAGSKFEPLKQSFSFAVGNFCEALTEYCTTPSNKVPDSTITPLLFQLEIDTFYETFFNTWLLSSIKSSRHDSAKTSESILNALTSIIPLLNDDKITHSTPKIVTTLLSLYHKKTSIDLAFATRVLHAIISKAVTVDGTLLEPLLGLLVQNLFDLVCVTVDYTSSESKVLLKNHSEVLRCYEVLGQYYTDNVINDHLLGKIKSNNDKDRVKSLIVITHLVSYSNEKMSTTQDLVLKLTDLVDDHNVTDVRLKRTIMNLILALSSKGLLNGDNDKLIEFLIKLCCTSQSTNVEILDTQKSADNALFILTTSVPELGDFMWTLLLKCLKNPQYDEAAIVVLKCLTHLGSNERDGGNDEETLARCLVLIANPLVKNRGTFALNFLKCFHANSINNIDKLARYLEMNYEDLNIREWHDLVIGDFVTSLLQHQDFIVRLLQNMRSQLDLYSSTPYNCNVTRHFILKCVAVILCHTSSKVTILETLDHLLTTVQGYDYADLDVAAQAIGICSRCHLNHVLDKLGTVRKEVLQKKSTTSKFLSFMTNNNNKNYNLNVDKIKYVLIAGYAEICNEAPGAKLLQTIESQILDYVTQELDTESVLLRKISLRAISCVADAMHPNRNTLHIRFTSDKKRDEVLKLVSAQMQLHNGPDYIESLPMVLPVITSLVKLPPVLESADRIKILQQCFENVYNASAIYCKIKFDQQTDEMSYGDLKLVPNVMESFTCLNHLVTELLKQSPTLATLDDIVTLLESWLAKRKNEHRLPSMKTLKTTLKCYHDNSLFGSSSGDTNFNQSGAYVSRIVPRCTDSNKIIRRLAVECLCHVLCIVSRHDGGSRDRDRSIADSLQPVLDRIESEDPKLLYNLAVDVARIVCDHLTPRFQFVHLIDGLIEALGDCESSSSSGSAVVLNHVLKVKGGELQHCHVTGILGGILDRLGDVTCARTVRSSILMGVLNLAQHHSKVVCQVLLNQPLPYDASAVEYCWSIISTSDTMTLDWFDQLKKIIKQNPLYDEQTYGTTDTIKIAHLHPLQAVGGLQELLKNNQSKDLCRQQFPDMFAILFVTMVTYIGVSAPALNNNKPNGQKPKDKYSIVINRKALKLNPAKMALDTLKSLLVCCDYDKTASILTGVEIDNGASDYVSKFVEEIVPDLVDNMYVESRDSLPWVVASLGPYIRSDFEGHRIAAVSFFTFLLYVKQIYGSHTNNNGGDEIMVENLLEMVLDVVQMDSSGLARKIGLRALGFASENVDLATTYSNQFLGHFMNSLNYNSLANESDVILEGMVGFSKLLQTTHLCSTDKFKRGTFQVTASVRIKPLLDHYESASLRRAAFRLLGDLALSLGGEAEAFGEQVLGNFVTLILHLDDPDAEVVKLCKFTLRQVVVYLPNASGLKRVNGLIQEHLIEEGNLHCAPFIKDLIKIMAEEMQDSFSLFIMTCISYLKSPWTEIRGNAALMVGLLFSRLVMENKDRVYLDSICDKLMWLLANESESEDVKMRAVESLTYLFI